MNEQIIIEALVTRLNECYTDIKTGILPDNNFYNGRFDGLLTAINTAIAGTDYKLIFDETTQLYDIEEA